MVMETIVEVVVGRANDKEIRHFEVSIEQEINELNSLRKISVQLALEAFSDSRDHDMEDMEDMEDLSFMVFYKGLRLPEEFDIPAVSDTELLYEVLAGDGELHVKSIEIYQRSPAGSLFIPDHNSFSVKRVSFEQALPRADAILANTEMKALLILEDFKYLRAGWD